MTPEDLASHIKERLEDKVTDQTVAYGQLTLTVEPEALPDAARLCKEDEALAFDFFEFMSGVDEREAGFSVVTNLYSVPHRHRIMLKVLAPGGREAPTLPSISHVYGGANWHEREAYDMFGITFEGHPGLEPRILTVENFEGWPLRKDFLLSTREAKPWPGAKEPGEPAAKGEEAASGTATHAAPQSGEDKAAAAKAKAERAKKKAAEMRAKKAAERAAAEGDGQAAPSADQDERGAAEGDQQPGPGEAAGTTEPGQGEGAELAPDGGEVPAPATEDTSNEATVAETPEATPATDAEEVDEPEAEGARAAAAAAAGEPVAEGTPDPTEPEGAAAVAGTDEAKDAAAGSVQGDTVAGAPGDAPDTEQPVDDPVQEAAAAEGAPAQASGTPGVEAEGRHGGAVEQTGEKPAADTTGMDAEPSGDAASEPERTPARDEDPPAERPAAPDDRDAPREPTDSAREGSDLSDDAGDSASRATVDDARGDEDDDGSDAR